ncbi:hypothetical protein CDQ91_10170 [Sphingopyxis witflariensis]|uniref:Uncharacterized protein n=2 Tax=Sphingopyxis witflariensis TaxID=173675 RepID=A0A246JZL3_9SPHN|nr:hypothetical protein CDQ91_10170 [Sphingopyxis witflariensis]
MARRCAAKYWQTGDPSDEAAARSILSGEWDDQAYTQAALAAIIETQEADAKLAEWAHMVPPDGGTPTPEECALAETIATAIRDGLHYGRISHD